MKTFLVAVMCVYSLTCFAQIRKGRMMVTGNLLYSNSSHSNDGFTSLYSQSWSKSVLVDLGAGYYVSPRIAMGIDVNLWSNDYHYDLGNTQSYGTLKQKNSNLRSAIFARFNISKGQKFIFFIEPSVGVGLSRSYSLVSSPNAEPTANDSRGKSIDLRLVAGVNYFINDHFALECRPGYVSWLTWLNGGEGINDRTFDIRLSMRSISFGVLFLFGDRD